MAFQSNLFSNYIKILQDPKKGIELLKIFGGNVTVDQDIDEVLARFAKKNTARQILDQDLEFQLLDVQSYHTENDDNDKSFNIMLFGKTNDDQSVYVHVDGFLPYFYVELDDRWTLPTIYRIIEDIKKKVKSQKKRNGLIRYKVVDRCKFIGFTNEKKFRFLELVFRDYDSMKAYSYIFQAPQKLVYLSRQNATRFTIYESNINPIIRFLHHAEIDPAGWIVIQKEAFKPFNDNYQTGQTDISVCCNWNDIKKVDTMKIHRFKILSFDIECTSEDGRFPSNRDGDMVIQIGMTYSRLGEKECFKKVVLCLNQTNNIDGSEVISFDSEKELLLAFTKHVLENDPDFIIGYNIFGFDFSYLKARAERLGILSRFSVLGRIKNHVCRYVEPRLESSAMGVNMMKYFEIPGRVCVDLLKIVQREHKLKSYKLDDVVAGFISGTVSRSVVGNHSTDLFVDSFDGVNVGDYISLNYRNGYMDDKLGNKYLVLNIASHPQPTITIEGSIDLEPYWKKKLSWCNAKDDIQPNDIFRFFLLDSEHRSKLAKYCIQDCALCNRLIEKLKIITNSISMANVCCVPIQYIFLRGQGVKLFSLVSRVCREEGYLIPVVKKKNPKTREETAWTRYVDRLMGGDDDDDEEEDNRYEGATVFEPVKGVHYGPIIVFDYGSLYPSCMIMMNLCHSSLVIDPRFDNLDGYNYHEITYINANDSQTVCRFAERKDGKKSIIPRILQKLLAERKKVQKMMSEEKEQFMKDILNILQNVLKITANSLYGQCGASTSPIYLKQVAACTTATGRKMLELAREYSEKKLPVMVRMIDHIANPDTQPSLINTSNKSIDKLTDGSINNPKNSMMDKYYNYMYKFFHHVPESSFVSEHYKGKKEYLDYLIREIGGLLRGYDIDPQCIYGDTDSIFFKLNLVNRQTKQKIEDEQALAISIKMGILSSQIINRTLKYPQVLNYEKVYWPFIIISKKRYVGNLYETDPKKYYQKSMGLVTKRRDNADIVKYTVGGMIDYIMNKRDKMGAVCFVKQTLKEIIGGRFDISKFVISKTLKPKEDYADWTRQAHVVLAERRGIREGQAIQSNERIPYVYVEIKVTSQTLQGDRVEDPQFIIENNMKIDYLFYITNQIMLPTIQFLELIVKRPNNIFQSYIDRELNRRNGICPVMSHLQNSVPDTENIISLIPMPQ